MDQVKSYMSYITRKIVLLPGGHDNEGHPLILITIPGGSPTLDLVPTLQYLLSIFRKTSRERGITVIIDARKGPWKVAKSSIQQVNVVFLPGELVRNIILRPDAFWDKQRVENCSSYPKEKQVIFIPRSRLIKYVNLSQLPTELGGNYVYDHYKWLESRQKIEEFYNDSDVALKELEELYRYVVQSKTLRSSQVEDAINTSFDMAESTKMLVHNATETAKELVQNIEYENRTKKLATEDFELLSTPMDTLDNIDNIHEVVDNIKKKQQEIKFAWGKMEKELVDAKDLTQLNEGVVRVINWILGPAENLLDVNKKVGFDVSSADELRKEHEAIELHCCKTYGAYAELIHKINKMAPSERLSIQQKNLMCQKDFMDFICKSFASRLERRRNILITSQRFFRLVAEYFDKTGDVFDSFVMKSKLPHFESSGFKLNQLQESQVVLEAVERELLLEGEKLSDMLSMPVKDSLGREIPVDYTEDIVNIKDIVEATISRKNIFSDSVELQKLTLKQVTHIDLYEKDALQAVFWLNDLLFVLLKNHAHVGCTVSEIQKQKEEHQSFQETAKGTYNYGCQLLNASLILRQSCKLSLDHHVNLYQKLRSFWQALQCIGQEQMTRLRVSAVFHRSVEEQCNQLRDLRETVATIPLMDPLRKRKVVNEYFGARDNLMLEVGRMVRLGRLLRIRLKDSLDLLTSQCFLPPSNTISCDSTETNEIAIEAISERLTEVTNLAEELEQALHSAQQDCLVFITTSTSTTSLIDPSASKSTMDSSNRKPSKSEDLRSDEEFLTASECTLQHSRSSSYNTASECENRYSPWWDYGKDDLNEDISNEKMVLAVGCPELPLAKDVLKPSDDVPPGKIVHEVTETTHIKVLQSHTLGVSSFVLTSETVRDKKNNNDGVEVSSNEVFKMANSKGSEILIPVDLETEDDKEVLDKIRKVSKCEDAAWKNYHKVTKQAVKGFI